MPICDGAGIGAGAFFWWSGSTKNRPAWTRAIWPDALFFAASSGVVQTAPTSTGLGGVAALQRLKIVLQAALLFNVGGDDASAETRGVEAFIAMHPENGDDQLGIAARHHADEPDIGIGGVSLAGLVERLVAHDLRRAGLAGQIDAFQVRRTRQVW